MNAAKVLGVDPVISAKEMADRDVDHLGVMAYAARLQALAPKKNLNHKNPPPPKSVDHSAPVPPPPPLKEPAKEYRLPPAERLKVMTPGQPAYANKKVSVVRQISAINVSNKSRESALVS